MQAHYDYYYALSVWKQFYQTYPRACNNFLRIYALLPMFPVVLFRNDQPLWNLFKRCIKFLDNLLKYKERDLNDHDYRELLNMRFGVALSDMIDWYG